MTEIRFYHLQNKKLEQALPEILTKAVSIGHRAVVKAPDTQKTEYLNDLLWTYHPNSFLPHGSAKDGHAAQQPIWLTHQNDNPNNANMLVLTGGCDHENIGDFDLCCALFDGNNPDAVTAARTQWKNYKESGHALTYWQQTAKGWEKKADTAEE